MPSGLTIWYWVTNWCAGYLVSVSLISRYLSLAPFVFLWDILLGLEETVLRLLAQCHSCLCGDGGHQGIWKYLNSCLVVWVRHTCPWLSWIRMEGTKRTSGWTHL